MSSVEFKTEIPKSQAQKPFSRASGQAFRGVSSGTQPNLNRLNLPKGYNKFAANDPRIGPDSKLTKAKFFMQRAGRQLAGKGKYFVRAIPIGAGIGGVAAAGVTAAVVGGLIYLAWDHSQNGENSLFSNIVRKSKDLWSKTEATINGKGLRVSGNSSEGLVTEIIGNQNSETTSVIGKNIITAAATDPISNGTIVASSNNSGESPSSSSSSNAIEEQEKSGGNVIEFDMLLNKVEQITGLNIDSIPDLETDPNRIAGEESQTIFEWGAGFKIVGVVRGEILPTLAQRNKNGFLNYTHLRTVNAANLDLIPLSPEESPGKIPEEYRNILRNFIGRTSP